MTMPGNPITPDDAFRQGGWDGLLGYIQVNAEYTEARRTEPLYSVHSVIPTGCMECGCIHAVSVEERPYGKGLIFFHDETLSPPGICASWGEALAQIRMVCHEWNIHQQGFFTVKGQIGEKPTVEMLKTCLLYTSPSPRDS